MSKKLGVYTTAMQKQHGELWYRVVEGTRDDSNVAKLLRQEAEAALKYRLWRAHLETLGEFRVWSRTKEEHHRRRVVARKAMTRHNAFLDEQKEFQDDEDDYLRDWPLDERVVQQLLESRRQEDEEFKRNGWIVNM
jgi:hypothetical protein